MPTISEAVLIALGVAMITTAGGWVGSWIQSRRTRTQARVDDATAAEKFANAAKTMIEPMRVELAAVRVQTDTQQLTIDAQGKTINAQQGTINKLERTQKANIEHINKLERKVVYLTHGVHVLTDQITQAGLTPEWVYSENGDANMGGSVDGHAADPDRSGSDGDAQGLMD